MSTKPVKVAMIGVGAISGIYLQNITHTFKELDLVGVCDLIPERAEKGAQYVRDAIQNGAKVREPKIYKDMFQKDPQIVAIHAGLECGLFLEKYPHLQMVSFGPTLRGVHSPDERLEIATVDKFWRHLKEIVKSL